MEAKNFLKSSQFKIILSIAVFIIIIPAIYYIIVLGMWQEEKNDNASLENKCQTESVKIFNSIQRATNSINYTRYSRYNAKAKRCYMIMNGIGIADIGTSDIIIDVFANKTVARCESSSTAPDQNYCEFDGFKTRFDIEEFNYFANLYMEAE